MLSEEAKNIIKLKSTRDHLMSNGQIKFCEQFLVLI